MKITLNGALSRLFVTSSAKMNQIWRPQNMHFGRTEKHQRGDTGMKELSMMSDGG